MEGDKYLQDKLAVKIWNHYFKRVEKLSFSLSKDGQQELKHEIADHMLESLKHEFGDDEADRLMNVIDKLGDPDEYIKPMIAGHYLESASKTFNPKSVVKGLYYNFFGGLKILLKSILYGIGYLFSFALGLVAILKVFMPDYVGLFVTGNGGFDFGITSGNPGNRLDLLGYWIIPIGIVISLGLYWLLTRKVSILKKEDKLS